MTYRLLDKIPLSGTAPECFFGDHQGHVSWIEFSDKTETWFGVFELGRLVAPKIKVQFLSDHINVLTQGNFYKINSLTKNCEFKVIDTDILDFIELSNNQSFVFVEQTGISTYKNNVRVKRRETNFTIDANIENINDTMLTMTVDRGEGTERINASC